VGSAGSVWRALPAHRELPRTEALRGRSARTGESPVGDECVGAAEGAVIPVPTRHVAVTVNPPGSPPTRPATGDRASARPFMSSGWSAQKFRRLAVSKAASDGPALPRDRLGQLLVAALSTRRLLSGSTTSPSPPTGSSGYPGQVWPLPAGRRRGKPRCRWGRGPGRAACGRPGSATVAGEAGVPAEVVSGVRVTSFTSYEASITRHAAGGAPRPPAHQECRQRDAMNGRGPRRR